MKTKVLISILTLFWGVAHAQTVYLSGPSSSSVDVTEVYWANWDFSPDEGEFNWWVDGGDTVYPDANWYSYTSCRVTWTTGGQGVVWYSYQTWDNYWEESFPVEVSSPTPIPDPPVLNNATNITATSFTISWSSVPSATSYRVEVTADSQNWGNLAYENFETTATTDNVTGLSGGTTYYYRVRAINEAGASDYAMGENVLTLPDAPIAYNPSNITCNALIAQWSAVNGADSYRLDVSTVNNFASFVTAGGVEYNNLGIMGTNRSIAGLAPSTTYYYRVRAENSFGGASLNSNVITVATGPRPTPSITDGPPTVCVNTGGHVYSTQTGMAGYSWSAPGGTITAGQGTSSATVTWNNSGSQTISVHYTSPDGCSSVTPGTRSVTVNPRPSPSITDGPPTACVNTGGHVYATQTGMTGYSWSAPGGTITAGQGTSSATVTWNTSGSQNVSVQYTNGNGCSSVTPGTRSVTVNPRPTPSITDGPQTVCVNTGGHVYTTQTGMTGYSWSAPGGTITTGQGTSSATVTWNTSGSQSASVQYTDGNGCSSVTPGTRSVTVNPPSNGGTLGPSVEAYGSASGTLSLTGAVTGSVVKWQNKIGVGSWTDIVYTNTSLAYTNVITTTSYRVEVKSGTCASDYSSEAAVKIYAVPSLSVDGESAIAPSESTMLVTDAGLYSYAWYRDGVLITGATANTLVVIKPGNYKVSVKATSTSPTYTTAELSIGSLALDEQPTPVNYIVSTLFLKEGVSEQTDLFDLERQDYSQVIQYFDGLGRPMQNVTRLGSPSGHDIVQPIVYDEFGREFRKYLPFVADETTGWYKDDVINSSTGAYQNAALNFYNNSNDAIADDGTPWAETKFEPSPLNRVLKQGAPGTTWQPDNNPYAITTDHSVKYDYEANEDDEVLLWTYISPTPTYPLGLLNGSATNSYSENQLFKTLTKDEDQHEMIEFRDKQAKVILKKVQGPDNTWAQTYYIYDDFGNLVCVLQPEGINHIDDYFNAIDTDKESFLEIWAFRYTYDGRKRMTMKQVPGADPVYMVYDDRDRLVLTQDGNQRNVSPTKEWTFTRYDALNRPVLTGIYESNIDLDSMQSAVNSFYDNLTSGQAWYDTYIGSTAGNVLGYDNQSFPQVSAESSYYTATYYDLYDSYIAPTGYTYLNESLPGQESEGLTTIRGQVTGSKVKNLSSGAWLRTINYYDDKYRVIQSVGDHQKGTIRTSNVYDFAGKILISKRTYVVNSATTTIKETYAYDHAGRVLNVKHSMNGGTDVMIVKNEYNEVGQLIDKKLHSTDGGSTFMQSIDHRYNIRGWLTKINEPDVAVQASGDPGYDYFGMELDYDNAVSGLSTTRVYNGNISAIQWSKGNGGSVGKQAYTYTYDPMNRLEVASHFDYEGMLWAGNNGSFQEKINEYDLNGNIKKLSRREFGGMLMDSLFYGYTGNQLNYVHDYGNQTEGFVNTNTGTDDYDYDFNGNLDKDRNKGLLVKGDIKYNYLNLPEEVVKGTESIKYTYDATGKKLAQEVYSNNGGTLVKTTDYIGELVYENNNLQFAQTSEGRILPDGGGWEYQYHLEDHLGNVRVTFTTKPQTPVSVSANMESGTSGSGESDFGNYTSTPYDLVDHTDAGTAYEGVQWLNGGGASGRVGLTKSLSVMPGDRVGITAYAKYMNLSGTGNTNAFAAALTAAFGVSSASTGEQLKIYNQLNDYGLVVAGGDHPDDDDTAPKAFVTILLFDRNYNLLDAAWDQITTDLEQVSATQKEPFAYPISKEVVVHEPGFAYIFVSNEHPTYVDVYFDDVTVTHTPSPIVSASDYYPFGLTFNSYQRENSVDQRWKFQGQEHIDDLGLNWDSFKWRNHQPDIGRFFNIDPLGDKYVHNSPYAFSENRVVNAIELEGLEALIVTTRNGAVERTRTATGAQVSSSTIAAGLLHPIAAMRVGTPKPGSTNISSVSGRIGRHLAEGGNMSRGDGTEENGFRHALWSASIAHEFGADIALKLTNTHEGIGPVEKVNIDFAKPLVQKTGLADGIVDILNNEIGRGIAGSLPENASPLDIAGAVLNVQRNEGLWTVSKDKDGNISISRQKITQQQFEQASERLTTLDNNGFNDADRKSLEEKKKK